jgi:hypothetical protein
MTVKMQLSEHCSTRSQAVLSHLHASVIPAVSTVHARLMNSRTSNPNLSSVARSAAGPSLLLWTTTIQFVTLTTVDHRLLAVRYGSTVRQTHVTCDDRWVPNLSTLIQVIVANTYRYPMGCGSQCSHTSKTPKINSCKAP